MNPKPISSARDSDLRLSPAAMMRAAERARHVATQTGTLLIVSRNGVIERIRPILFSESHAVQEASAPYGPKT